MKKNFFIIAFFTICTILMTSVNAYAYLDPSVTTYLIQIISGICVTLGVVIIVFKNKILNFFRKIFYKKKK